MVREILDGPARLDLHVSRPGAGVDRHSAERTDGHRQDVRGSRRRRGRRTEAGIHTRRPQVAPGRETSVRLARRGRQLGATTESDRELEHPGGARRQPRPARRRRRGERRSWRGSRWSSWPRCRTNCARRSPSSARPPTTSPTVSSPISTQIKKYGELVRGEGRRLTEMVEQILEFAGIQSGQRGLALQPVSVEHVLREVVAASGSLIDGAGMDGRVGHPPRISRRFWPTSPRCAACSRT